MKNLHCDLKTLNEVEVPNFENFVNNDPFIKKYKKDISKR